MNDNQKSNQEPQYVEEEITYTRRRRVYTYYCSLPDCPYCHNKPLQAFHPSRKWCCDDARAEFRRRERAEIAIQEGRDPGVVGPPANLADKEKHVGAFFIHALDDSDLYRIGYSDTWEAYETQYLNQSAENVDFDAIVAVRAAMLDSLSQKIHRKFEHLHVEDNLFRLAPADVKVAHQMVLEHVEAHSED